jgi:hypothetical protein
MENQDFPTMNLAPSLPSDGIYQKLLVRGRSQRDSIALSHYTEFPTTPFRSHQLHCLYDYAQNGLNHPVTTKNLQSSSRSIIALSAKLVSSQTSETTYRLR